MKHGHHGDNGSDSDDNRFRRGSRRMLFAWIALIALLLSSLASAYLSVGVFNPVVSLTIAALKTAIVVWLFMELRHAGVLIRLVSLTGLAMLALLVGLSGVDFATRSQESVLMQQPRQLPSLRQSASSS